jgi:ABC-type Fe3+-hydroxamate transport system substrate-binding protein
VNGNALVDALGTAHQPATGSSRIVCLVPSITELLFDLDLAEQVVGRTRFCVHPAEKVARVKRVGGTKTIKLAEVKALAPTHVIVNVDENPKALLEQLAPYVPNVIVTHPLEPEDNLALYQLLGGIFRRQIAAEQLCRQFRTALGEVLKVARSLPQRPVLYLIWKDPWMTVSASTYIARMLSLVRWTTVGDDPNVRYPTVDISTGLLNDTDIVLFSTEPYPFKQTHLEALRAECPVAPPMMTLIDAQMTSWYGSRAIRGLAYLGRFAAELAGSEIR